MKNKESMRLWRKAKNVIEDQEKQPKLVFVSEDGVRGRLYIDGVDKTQGAVNITIHADMEDGVRHEIEYITALAQEGEGASKV